MNPFSPRRRAFLFPLGGVCLAALLALFSLAVFAAPRRPAKPHFKLTKDQQAGSHQNQANQNPSQQEKIEQPTILFVRNPDPAPLFKLTALDGKPLALAAAQGKVVLLNFWATWCGPCRAEIPALVDLQQKYKDRLQIIGLDVDDDDIDAVKKFAERFDINYPVALTPDDVRMDYGGIAALPTSFVIDQQGRVVQKHVGLWDPSLYETEIRALLGLPIDAKVETFEDTGEIFLKHADRATELPGVNLSKLTSEQRKVALHRFNAESCTCGCHYTLAQCRIYDSACQVSRAATQKIVAAVSAPAAPSPARPASPSSIDPAPAPAKPSQFSPTPSAPAVPAATPPAPTPPATPTKSSQPAPVKSSSSAPTPTAPPATAPPLATRSAQPVPTVHAGTFGP